MTNRSKSSSVKNHTVFWRSRIGRRLLLAILAFSSLITLTITSSDLYMEYADGVSVIRERLRQIEISYAASLGESLWNLDKRQIALQLRGIAELPDIRSVELRETTPGSQVRFAVTVENSPPGPGEQREIPVWCNCGGSNRTIGILHVETTHVHLFQEILRHAQMILIGQAVKTFLVATFILFVVHHLVTRRLLRLTGAMASFVPGEAAPRNLRDDIRLRRAASDEFDELAEIFEGMWQRLERYGADLRTANARMEAILDNIPDLAWIKDAEGRFIACNRPLATLHGRGDPAELIGCTDDDISPPELAAAYRDDEVAVMRSRTTRRVEEWHVRPDNSLFPIETIRTPLYDGNGGVIGTVGIARDVTVRKAMEEELRQTALALETIVANLPGLVFRMHYPANGLKRPLMIDGGSINGRAADRRLLELTPEEFARRFHPDDDALLNEEVPRRLREEGTAEFVFRMRDEGGDWQWVRTWERVVARDGDDITTEGLSLNVTAEMTAKLALETSTQRYRDLVHVLPVGVFEDEPGKGCVYASELWTKITGLTQQEILGDGWARAIHPDDRVRTIATWMRNFDARQEHEDEFRLVHTDGHETWVLARALPRLSVDGALLGYIGCITDISDRKISEESLKRLNQVLRLVAAGTERLIQQSDKQGVYSTVCQLLVEMGGYELAWIGLAEHDERKSVQPVAWAGSADGYISTIDVSWDETPVGMGPTGRAIRSGLPEIIYDIEADPTMEPWKASSLSNGLRSCISLPLKTESAVLGCLNLYSSKPNSFSEEEAHLLQDFAHNVAFTIVAMRERRRRLEVERHLQQAQKMEALGLLAGSVAHDFNNLLGAIQGFAGFIAEDSVDDDPAHYYAQRILLAGKRGKALIGQILSFSRQLEMKREAFAVADLVAETTALLTASVTSTTQVEVEAAPECGSLTGDHDLLGQALFNLCMNANEALGSQPGTISIRTRPADLSRKVVQRLVGHSDSDAAVWEGDNGELCTGSGVLDPARCYVSISVSDTGCGMAGDVLERIFVPFFSTKQRDLGTGLGLAAVQRTVTAHEGAILVTSVPGQGSTFELILPCNCRESLPEAPSQQPRPQPQAVAGRILLVDDNADFGDMLLTALERRGFDVSPCSDPLDALAGIKEFPGAWDVMITDQTMPEMSGLELIRATKAIQPDLPCILCTGYAEDHLDEATLAEAGAETLLRKPVDIDDLVELLARYLPH